METGVYMIINRVNGKVYVGSTQDCFTHREKVHKAKLKKGNHPNGHLQSAWNKYGEVSFIWKILERVPKDSCIKREQAWLDDFGPEYNKRIIATSNKGAKFSDIARKNISMAQIGLKRKPHTEETKAKMRAKHLGKKLTEEHKNKIRQIHIGRKHTAEARKNMSVATKKMVGR